MILGVDIGNSGLKVAILEQPGKVGAASRITWQHDTPAKRQELDNHTGVSASKFSAVEVSHQEAPGNATEALRRFHPNDNGWLVLIEEFLKTHSITAKCHWRLSSVRNDAELLFCDWVRARPRDCLSVVSVADVPMQVDVDEPGKLGIDRLLAAYAASCARNSRPMVVIQAGSAVTVDLLCKSNGQDVYCGGAILPGIPMMLRLLGQGADRLPAVSADDLTDLPPLPGKNTQQAMHAGAASALVGGVIHLVSRYRSEYGMDTPIVVSGGDGNLLLPHIAAPAFELDQLVLSGLSLLYDS